MVVEAAPKWAEAAQILVDTGHHLVEALQGSDLGQTPARSTPSPPGVRSGAFPTQDPIAHVPKRRHPWNGPDRNECNNATTINLRRVRSGNGRSGTRLVHVSGIHTMLHLHWLATDCNTACWWSGLEQRWPPKVYPILSLLAGICSAKSCPEAARKRRWGPCCRRVSTRSSSRSGRATHRLRHRCLAAGGTWEWRREPRPLQHCCNASNPKKCEVQPTDDCRKATRDPPPTLPVARFTTKPPPSIEICCFVEKSIRRLSPLPPGSFSSLRRARAQPH